MGIFKRSNLAELIFGQFCVSYITKLECNGLVEVWKVTPHITGSKSKARNERRVLMSACM